jgi:HEAT repeat protein
MTDTDDAERAAELRKRAEQDDPDTIDIDGIGPLLDADDAEIRRDATETVARLSTGATDQILELSTPLAARLDDDSPVVRANATMALAAIAEARPQRVRDYVDALASRLSDSTPTVRASATLALSNVAVDAPENVAAVVDATVVESLLTDSNRDVRGNGVELLIELVTRGIDDVLNGSVRDRLTDRLDDDAWFVRERACLAVGVVGDEDARELLEARAAQDRNETVREAAESALEHLGED